jgi:hypothetical protein
VRKREEQGLWAEKIVYWKKKMRKTYLRKDAYSPGPEEQRSEQQQLEPGRLLVAVDFSRLGRGKSLLRCGCLDFNVVEVSCRAWS